MSKRARQTSIVGELAGLRLDPNFIIMKSGAAEWRDRIGTGQGIYAAAVRVGAIGPDRLSDQHAAADPVVKPRMEDDLATAIAEHDRIARGDSCSRGIGGMDQNLGPSFPRNRARRLSKRRVEEAPCR